jgi:RNA polymerase sigma-70 factor (ECF subfamily)
MKRDTVNKELFTNLYNSESDAIFRYCLIRTSNREVALDITQDTFTRLWKVVERGEEIGNYRAFLYTVARNLIIDWYRKKKPESLDAIADETNVDALVVTSDSVREDIEMSAEARFLISKIKDLEEQYQQPVFLRFIEGLKPSEIADIMDVSVNVASVRISRGIDRLRKLVGYEKTSLWKKKKSKKA